MLNRVITFSLFWFTLAGYFIIPIFIQSIPCPRWIIKIDSYIPFIWWMIIPYFSYYFLLILPPIIIKSKVRIKILSNVLIYSSLFCYSIYIIWPISSTSTLLLVKNNPLSFIHNMVTLDYLHQNAFPSMHVTISIIIGLALIEEKIQFQKSMYLLILLIFFATFLTKQHYLIDSLFGGLIGYFSFLYYKKLSIKNID